MPNPVPAPAGFVLVEHFGGQGSMEAAPILKDARCTGAAGWNFCSAADLATGIDICSKSADCTAIFQAYPLNGSDDPSVFLNVGQITGLSREGNSCYVTFGDVCDDLFMYIKTGHAYTDTRNNTVVTATSSTSTRSTTATSSSSTSTPSPTPTGVSFPQPAPAGYSLVEHFGGQGSRAAGPVINNPGCVAAGGGFNFCTAVDFATGLDICNKSPDCSGFFQAYPTGGTADPSVFLNVGQISGLSREGNSCFVSLGDQCDDLLMYIKNGRTYVDARNNNVVTAGSSTPAKPTSATSNPTSTSTPASTTTGSSSVPAPAPSGYTLVEHFGGQGSKAAATAINDPRCAATDGFFFCTAVDYATGLDICNKSPECSGFFQAYPIGGVGDPHVFLNVGQISGLSRQGNSCYVYAGDQCDDLFLYIKSGRSYIDTRNGTTITAGSTVSGTRGAPGSPNPTTGVVSTTAAASGGSHIISLSNMFFGALCASALALLAVLFNPI